MLNEGKLIQRWTGVVVGSQFAIDRRRRDGWAKGKYIQEMEDGSVVVALQAEWRLEMDDMFNLASMLIACNYIDNC